MKEIKFRAINKDQFAMGFFDALSHRVFTLKGLISVPSIEIMQYTGLKDISGVEIYENDLVTVSGHYEGDNYSKEFIGVIEFSDGSYSIINDERIDCCELDSASIENYNIQVSGNIYNI
jgi:uncharacterized phage protein (TIGR01671 family)